MVPTPRHALLFIPLLLAACGFDRPVTPGDPRPLIKGLLVADADSQYFLLEWASPADSDFSNDPHPIDPSLVALTVTGGGASAPLVPFSGVLSNYVTTLPVRTDSTYSLTGTVDGSSVSALTQVPHGVTVTTELPDTVIIDSLADCDFFCTVPFQVSAVGADGFLLELRDSTGAVLQVMSATATTDSLQLEPFIRARRLYVYAVDANAAAWLFSEEPASSVEGAVGLFGSAVLKKLVVRWQ